MATSARSAKKSAKNPAKHSAVSKKEKVVLAYSGGLDTSVIVRWLEQRGYDVICFCANVGQVEKYQDLEKKALNSGGSKCYIRDVQEELTIVDLTRSQLARILRKLPDGALTRFGTHNERGPRTLEQLLTGAIDHIRHHLKFVHEKRAALGLR